MKILILVNQPPWPLCYGDRLHIYELCRRLAGQHELMMLAWRSDKANDRNQIDVPERPPFEFPCHVYPGSFKQNQALPQPVRLMRAERYFGIDAGFVAYALSKASEWKPDVVLGMGFQSLSCLARIKDVPTVCDMIDDGILHAWLELRHGKTSGWWGRLKCLLATMMYERKLAKQLSAITVVSETDRRVCARYTGHPHVLAIPHGTDCDHYAPTDAPVDDNQIVFWGSLTFEPNIGAILYFAEQVWPIVKKQRPELCWTIMGRGWCDQLQPVKELPGVDFLGQVDDVRPHVAPAAVVVVPMLSGAGIKNKIMEAWAMGKPVLCTRRALGDLPGEHGENVWLADSPNTLADGLLQLLNNRELREKIGRSASKTAVEKCSWDVAARQLEQVCLQLAL